MGASANSNATLKDTIDNTVMQNIYEMANTCKIDQNQKQQIIVKVEGDINLQNVTQKQTSSTDLSCLADNKLSQLFTQDFKNSLAQSLKSATSGVGTIGISSNFVSDTVVNNLYTTNSIKSIQDAITNVSQNQLQLYVGGGDMNAKGNISQEQISDAIMSQISSVSSDSIVQAEKQNLIESSSTSEVVGADITAISTTAIKTVGSVLTTFANAMIIGAIILVIVMIIAVVGIIIFVKKNCSNIKKGLDNAYKKIPIPMVQLKAISMLLGMLCPDKEPEQSSNQNQKSSFSQLITKSNIVSRGKPLSPLPQGLAMRAVNCLNQDCSQPN